MPDSRNLLVQENINLVDRSRREILRDIGALTCLGTISGSTLEPKEPEGLERFAELIDPEDPEVERVAGETGMAKLGSLLVNYPDRIEFQPASDEEVFGQNDYWSRPSEYIENDFRGDCDDYSIFNTSLFLAKDIDSRSVFDLREGRGHVLTEIKYDGDYWVTDVRDAGDFYLRSRFNESVDWKPEKMTGGEQIEPYDPSW